mmetsp:Transcript_21483/g.61358  ORF Transcript_21483/g.61358 Transcript_21483/m.61358 type:complete len:419 (-) Transcript_21483:500-1756(-)
MSATILADDLETYVGQYGSHGAVQRLLFVMSTSEDKALKIEAGKLCLDMLKRTTNAKGYTETYNAVKELMEGGDAAPPQYDSVWVEATQKQTNILKDLYEQDLHQAKASQIKENIRNCHAQLTNLCIEQGDYTSALKYVSKSREFCTDAEAVFSTCMTIIKLSALLQQYTSIQSFASKAQHTPFKDEAGNSKIQAAYGLFYMTSGKYRNAALSFAQVKQQDLGVAFGDVVCAQDVALYGVLCGLASLDRGEIQSKLLECSHFRECLDLVPQIRDIAMDFCSFKYAACLVALERLRGSLSLDVHLHTQVTELCSQIRSKGIVQYFAPFLSVSLHSMAEAFNTDVDGIQSEVAQLVGKRQLDAKIDSHKKILHVRHANQRRSTYQNAMRVSQDFVDTTQALVLRMNLLKHDFGVHLVRKK